jgi:hypothetical protein
MIDRTSQYGMTMTDWKALAGRITLFAGSPASGPLLKALDLFQIVWNGNPDNFQSNPNVLMPSFANGKRDGLTVGCIVQPTRIDFNFTPPPPISLEDGSTPLALIEDTTRLHNELARVIGSIDELKVTSSVSRVGLFLHFLSLVSDVEAANKLLISVMPNQYHVQITKEEDFIFQINRPRMSHNVEGIKLNSLAKWNVDRFQVFNVAIAAGSPVVDSRTMPSRPEHEFIAASVVLDINNVPTNDTLNGKQQSSLLIEGLSEMIETQRGIGLNVEGF